MQETERIARDYLAGRRKSPPPPGWTPPTAEAYVRALLSCALLAQGRAADARDALRWTDAEGVVHALKARTEIELTRENVAIAGAIHATSACRAAEARMAGDAFLAGNLPGADFVREYGSFAGLQLASADSPDRDRIAKLAARSLEESCAPGDPAPGKAAEAARAELRRTLAEQVYNDAISLVARMPPPPEGARAAEHVWLAKVAVKGATVYRYLIPDMLPVPLSGDQKAWQREQAFPVFKNARALGGWFLSAEARGRVEETRAGKTPDEMLYDRLLSAQIEVLAWIDSR
jgi:hypothetical protein